MKLGAIHREAPAHVPRFASLSSLPAIAPPASVDWLARCPADGDALGNGTVGNCVPCAELRAIQLRRAIVWGDPTPPTQDEALALYAADTAPPFDPITGANDAGTDTSLAMSRWATSGVALRGKADVSLWAALDPGNVAHLRLALWALGPLQFTLALPIGAQDPASWASPPGTGDAWQPASWGNHRVMAGAYDAADGFTSRSWGQDFRLHPEFLAGYLIGADATLSQEWIDPSGRSPSGLLMTDLRDELRQVAA